MSRMYNCDVAALPKFNKHSLGVSRPTDGRNPYLIGATMIATLPANRRFVISHRVSKNTQTVVICRITPQTRIQTHTHTFLMTF